jgi:hypothetical protein
MNKRTFLASLVALVTAPFTKKRVYPSKDGVRSIIVVRRNPRTFYRSAWTNRPNCEVMDALWREAAKAYQGKSV